MKPPPRLEQLESRNVDTRYHVVVYGSSVDAAEPDGTEATQHASGEEARLAYCEKHGLDPTDEDLNFVIVNLRPWPES